MLDHVGTLTVMKALNLLAKEQQSPGVYCFSNCLFMWGFVLIFINNEQMDLLKLFGVSKL